MSKIIGDHGEDIAVEFLIGLGYKILARNYRTRYAEVDIIAVYDGTVVFIEVKSRKSTKYGLPEEVVNRKKLNKIKLAGQEFLKNIGKENIKARIEVVSIILTKPPEIKLIQHG